MTYAIGEMFERFENATQSIPRDVTLAALLKVVYGVVLR